jgi:NitT/TauT family transport system substrate-binding protein
MTSGMSRRTALVGLGAAPFGLAARPASAADKLRVGKAVAENFGNVPLDVGMANGIFAKQGLEIEEINFAGGAQLAQAVVAGAVDISLSSGTELALIAKGVPELAVATITESPAFMGIAVGSRFSGYGIDALKGKKIGITTAGSLTEWVVEALNRAKSWQGADRAIAIAIGGSPTAVFAALKVGQIDADIGGPATGYQLEEQNAGRLLIDCSEFLKTIQLFTIFASTTIRQQNPGAVRRFLKGWFETIGFMKTHRAETLPIASKVTGFSLHVVERVYDALMMKFSTDGRFSHEAMETLRASLVDMRALDSTVDLAKFYTAAYLPER